MLTRCPQCQTTFRVSQAHLDAANGMVRCGKCQHIFNAEEHISQAQAADESRPTDTPKKATKPAPPPQVDWLQQTSTDEQQHIDLGQQATTDDDVAVETKAEQSPSVDTLAEITSLPADSVTEVQYQTDRETKADTETEATSILPGEFAVDSEDDDQTAEPLAGIEPAYEDDRHLNYRDEQGLNDLQGEIQRQLEASADELLESPRAAFDDAEMEITLTAPEAETDTEDDAYESVLDYLEEEEAHPGAKQSPIENIELASAPEGNGSVNWNDEVHHDPEIPAALRSSMQALEKRKRRPLTIALMSLSLVVLLAALGLQLILFRSHDIATQWPQSRPLLTQVCQSLPCVYSGRREPRKIQLVSRDVRVHPSAKHALLISATVVNQAGHAQPYPRLAIKLSDLAGEVVAERVFEPNEYLKQGESRLKLMRPEVPTLISLEVMDPGSEAVNFEFRFL